MFSNPNLDTLSSRQSETNNTAIRVTNLSKCYQIYGCPRDRLKQFLLPRLQRVSRQSTKQYFREFWALKDVSFEIKRGETVGIIGRNGSGKSTLLQIICGTLSPTHGTVETRGRIAALLELGSGFNPEFTGRENIYLSATMLGMTGKEIDERFDDIAAFADIGSFIEQPVKTYSSGMFVRLAFAVNIICDPEIMIVDEALAVGDMAFQAKCMTALTRLQDRGATVLFVSHDIGALKSLCSRGIHLEKGRISAIGNAPEVAERYIRAMRETMNAEYQKTELIAPLNDSNVEHLQTPSPECEEQIPRSQEFNSRAALHRYGSGGAQVTYAELLNMDNEPVQAIEFNQQVKIRIYAEASAAHTVSINFSIHDDKKLNITGSGFIQAGKELLNTVAGGSYIAEYILKLPLQQGNYSIRTQITCPHNSGETAEFLDVIDNALVFNVSRWNQAAVWSKVHLFPQLNLIEA